MTILVTGAAGFIGYHLCQRLLKQGYFIVGIDNLNDYYDVNLKTQRLRNLGIELESPNTYIKSSRHKNLTFVKLDLIDEKGLQYIFNNFRFDVVCHLAAQAGVRYSIENPKVYIQSNIVGFINLLECIRHKKINKLVYASSSSIYGNNHDVPFDTKQNTNYPISVYAATKKSNELLAYTYSHLYDIQTIGLRFFTVYGPWGRPDMAFFSFTKNILNGIPINVFNNGNLSRDFTYIEDIIDGVSSVILKPNEKSNYLIYNIGNSKPVNVLDFIREIEKNVGKQAHMIMMPMQPGDVTTTWANIDDFSTDYDYHPKWTINKGIAHFVDWYKSFYAE